MVGAKRPEVSRAGATGGGVGIWREVIHQRVHGSDGLTVSVQGEHVPPDLAAPAGGLNPFTRPFSSKTSTKASEVLESPVRLSDQGTLPVVVTTMCTSGSRSSAMQRATLLNGNPEPGLTPTFDTLPWR